MKKLFLCIIWTGFCLGLLLSCKEEPNQRLSDLRKEREEKRKNLEKLLEERKNLVSKIQNTSSSQAAKDALQERLGRINRQIALAEELKRNLSALDKMIKQLSVTVSCVCNHYYEHSDSSSDDSDGREQFVLKGAGATEDEARDNVLESCEAKLESTGSYSDAHIGNCEVKN